MAYQQTAEETMRGLAWGLLACIKIAQKTGLTRTEFVAAINRTWTR